MVNHLTVRLAWHDANWNGKVCNNPEENVFCNGTYSLLSPRIQRNKRAHKEKEKSGEKINSFDDYLPPCYWSCNAFSKYEYNLEIEHPFAKIKAPPIKDRLSPYSVYTWPFRLSFNHSYKKKKLEGKYPPDLKKRIETFFDKFVPNETIIFFYLNYDNPVSADEERKYVLVGCSALGKIDPFKNYKINPDETKRIKRGKGMKNFPKIMWAVQLQHHFKETGILLPYKEYLERVDKFPEENEKLKEMRVLIDEASLRPSFKYVAEELDQDKCIYLLYKIRKSIEAIEKHGIVKISREKKKIETLIQNAWEKRGLYPSLPRILDIIAGVEKRNKSVGQIITDKLIKKFGTDPQSINVIFKLLTDNKKKIPTYLKSTASQIKRLRRGFKDLDNKVDILRKLCLFEFTSYQLKRIIYNKNNPFKKTISATEIISNPYLLAENYKAEDQNLDHPEVSDGPIDVFKIDIGMLPDTEYIEDINDELQNLTFRSPERIRSIIIDHLKKIGEEGDCYDSLNSVHKAISTYPLFYKEEQDLDKTSLVSDSDKYLEFFKDRLIVKQNKDNFFFYLKEVYYAESLIKETVTKLLQREDWKVKTHWVDDYINNEVNILSDKIPDFDSDCFKNERSNLLRNILRESLYILSGKPGSGKTFALRKVVDELKNMGEQITMLAPTGKATLRLKEQTGFLNAQTIDMFLHSRGYSDYLDDFENILIKPNVKKQLIDNLIIDETSMVDLQKLAILFSLIYLEGPRKIKRVILVGDEKQLPPIGFGRPFVDIIEFIKYHEEYKNNYCHLVTNCRQEHDKGILALAEVFGYKNRYYEEILSNLMTGGQISPGLIVETWRNREELQDKIDHNLEHLIGLETHQMKDVESCECKAEYMNLLFGLYKNGFVKNNSAQTLALDTLQLLSPYRGRYYGVLGINEFFKENYREPHHADEWFFRSSPFDHADKIIRTNNWYRRGRGTRTLILSNGSIGIPNNKRFGNKFSRRYYFTDQEHPLDYIDSDENFDLAYAITIHKSQGSDFKNVFLVIPEKTTLLSKELLYTALTRSRYRLTLFIENNKSNPLEVARTLSFVLSRNTSIFEAPEDYKKIYHPDKDVHVRSRVEYIIYTALKSEGILPQYEKELVLKNRSYKIHPDFTIEFGNQIYYWEHLGRLDVDYYSNDWRQRKEDYKSNKLYDNLITTDDLGGINSEKLLEIIQDIKRGKFRTSKGNKFSNHHYKLYD